MRLRRFVQSLLAVTIVVPVVFAQTPNRTTPPAPGPPPSLKPPAIQKHTLSNGLPVWLVEVHKVPVVDISLVVLAGAGADPAGRFGVASMTAAMLDEGAGSRSALEIADAVDFLGATLSTGCSFDASTIGLWVPVARLADALPVMADVALRPAFPAQELERLRKDRLTALLQARDDPRSLADIAFPRLVYGATHRYGTAAGGTPTTVRSFTVDDLRAFYNGHFRPANASLLVVGDVTAAGVLPLLEKAFGGWKPQGTPATAAQIPAAPQVAARQVYVIDKPGAPQSQIRIGYVGVARSTPDYYALEVLNTLLGGSFTSRLNQNLREQHGYTYGAGSSFAMRVAPGPFVASSGVQGDKTAESLKEFFNELTGIVKPIPPDEAARARNYVALRFPGEFEAVGDISQQLASMVVYKLPADYAAGYIGRIGAVQPADLLRVAQKYIQPDRMVVVVVGDRKSVEAGVRALNLGPITFMSVEEAVGPAQ